MDRRTESPTPTGPSLRLGTRSWFAIWESSKWSQQAVVRTMILVAAALARGTSGWLSAEVPGEGGPVFVGDFERRESCA